MQVGPAKTSCRSFVDRSRLAVRSTVFVLEKCHRNVADSRDWLLPQGYGTRVWVSLGRRGWKWPPTTCRFFFAWPSCSSGEPSPWLKMRLGNTMRENGPFIANRVQCLDRKLLGWEEWIMGILVRDPKIYSETFVLLTVAYIVQGWTLFFLLVISK